MTLAKQANTLLIFEHEIVSAKNATGPLTLAVNSQSYTLYDSQGRCMHYIHGGLLSVTLGYIYFIITVAMIGLAAAGKIFWWFEWSDNFHIYHIAQNFIGIGLAALLPSYLVYHYEPGKKWLFILIVVLSSLLFHGNVNHNPLDPNGLVRFFNSTVVHGDMGSLGVLIEMIFWPIIWLCFLKRLAPQ